MKKSIFLLLALVIILAACPGEDEITTDEVTTYSAWPVITLHPTSADYTEADTVEILSVNATASDSGTLSYQWFEADSFVNSDGTAIAGQTNKTFTPQRGEDGTEQFYYAVVTNSKGSLLTRTRTSNPARIRFLSLSEVSGAPAVNVNISGNNAQYVRGFGGMSNAFGINPPGVARYMALRDIDTMFNPDTGLGFNILRIMLWPYPLEMVISGEIEPQMGNQTYFEIVKRVNRYGGYVLASPWTPPPEWKINQVENGTSPSYLLPQHYADYAEYLANFARTMARNGAPVYSVSVQNEPSFPASYAGCEWTSAQHLAFFLTNGVGRFMNKVPGYGGGKDLDSVLVMSGEPHQNVTWNDTVKNNSQANALVDIYSYHTYGRMDNAYRDVQTDASTMRKEVWMTEHNINSGPGLEAQDYSWNYVWALADEIDHVIRINDTNAFVWWYLKRYYCMVGDNAYGTIDGAILPRGWVMSHWAKYATDTIRVPATVTGHPGTGNTSDASSTGVSTGVNVKASAFRRKAEPVSYWEHQVKKQEDSISLVIYDKRTVAATEGQNIRINLPADFTATNVHAIISDNNNKHAPALIVLARDGNTADFFLPGNSIMSIKFTK